MGIIEKLFFGKKSEVSFEGKKSEVSFERFSGSGVCDVCNKGIGDGDAYLVPNDTFYASKKYRERMEQSGMLFGQSVDDFIAVTKSMDQTAHSAVCQDCIYLFKN